jgi:signal transduction histidine kinase
VKRLKALAVELHPPDLDMFGLIAALRQYFLDLSRVTKLSIEFTAAVKEVEMSAETQTALFRAAQECLNNVVAHARARHVIVKLSVTQNLVKLSVSDDGKGFDTGKLAKNSGRHLGLLAMTEMAGSLGGDVVVESAEGNGTTVRVIVPKMGPLG